MATADVTITGVSKKKKPSDSGQPPSRSPAYTLFARVRPELGRAWEAYLSSLRPKPTAVSAVELMMEEFLQQQGFWPPPG